MHALLRLPSSQAEAVADLPLINIHAAALARAAQLLCDIQPEVVHTVMQAATAAFAAPHQCCLCALYACLPLRVNLWLRLTRSSPTHLSRSAEGRAR